MTSKDESLKKEILEKDKSLRGQKRPLITFYQAIEMGEYNPSYLKIFPEWHQLSRHVQFQYIRQALDNKRRQLLRQWAEVNNMLDFRLKPHLKEALENIQTQMKKLDQDREKLYVEYSSEE